MTGPVPAEWAPHRAMWVGFPSHAELWEDDLAPAQEEVAALVRALAKMGEKRVFLMTRGEPALRRAQSLVEDESGVEIVPGEFGDVWLRDTGPIFLSAGRAASFRFNGWGGKYDLPGDDMVAEQIVSKEGAALERHKFIIEGGALDHDGEGTVLTTRQCLLNPNRNPNWTEAAAETALKSALGATKVIWLDDGLANDHTDGHVDNLARFTAPGRVACPEASGPDDPNAAVYEAAARTLEQARDAAGRTLRVTRVPSPGRIVDGEGNAVPASHMNFVITGSMAIMPCYLGREAEAKAALNALLKSGLGGVLALRSNALLTGGGSFHCITQQVPA